MTDAKGRFVLHGTTHAERICGPNLHPQWPFRSRGGGQGAYREYFTRIRRGGAKRGDDIGSLAARALGEHRQPVVAGGGDGTINAVAGKLVGTDTVLGVLPMGTLNHFAKDVGVPLNLQAAVRNLFTGQVTNVDVGEVNGRVFVNNSGVGFYPHFVRQREEQEQRGHIKRVAFMLALRSVVRRYFRLRMKVHMDQAEALEHVTPFLFVGNNRYQTSGLQMGTRSKLDSGRLWVCTAPSSGPRNILRIGLRTLLGRETDQELNAFEVEELGWSPGPRGSTCPSMVKSVSWTRRFTTEFGPMRSA
jgi:diacylglycerol kinase family enzyme